MFLYGLVLLPRMEYWRWTTNGEALSGGQVCSVQGRGTTKPRPSKRRGREFSLALSLGLIRPRVAGVMCDGIIWLHRSRDSCGLVGMYSMSKCMRIVIAMFLPALP